MKMYKIAGLIVVASIMSGCSTINYNVKANTEFFSEPPIDQVVEVYVGDYMLDQGKSTTTEYLTLEHFTDGMAYDIPSGSYMRIGDYKNTPYFSTTNTNSQSIRYTAGLIDPPIALHINKTNEICVTSVSYQTAACYKGQSKIEEKTLTNKQSFQQTLIYNGSVGKKINISYREFSDNSARNAFTNNVEYDMSKSKVLNYKGAQIKVLSYDNTSIKFKVLKHFRSDYSVNL